MNLLFFIHSLSSGGAERVTAMLANYWVSRDWQVTIVTMAGPDSDFYRLAPEVQSIHLNMTEECRNPVKGVINNVRRIRALRSIIRSKKPDVAVAMMPTANVTLALATRLTGVPAVGSERIYPPGLHLGRVWSMLRRWSYPLLNGIVAQTVECAAWLRDNAPTKAIRVIPNPVDYPLEEAEPRASVSDNLPGLPGQKILLAVGRLEPQKGFRDLIDAFAQASHRHPNWTLVIVGQGPLKDCLADQAKSLGIQKRVVMPGLVGNIGDWYSAADAYALTSLHEGFPNTLVEALAYGLPVVSIDCKTGPNEIIRDGVDGLLVPEGDMDALIVALDQLMGNQHLRQRFAERATEARERFRLDRIAGQWEQFLHECQS